MYNRYFGFQKSPFGVTPDADLFYSNAVYQEAFAALRYGIREKKGFILITGEAGSGKTVLLRKFMLGLQATTQAVFVFNTYLGFTELLQFILRDLELPTKGTDRATMIDELNGYLIEQFRKGHIVSLLIDEAQNLSDETLEGLRLLSNLETDNQKLVQIVLMGQPELETRLDQPNLRQVKQRVALRCRLARLKSTEVGPYIDFTLQAAGYKKKALFRRDAVEQIALYSMGIPRLINMICDNALLAAYASSKKQIAAEMIHEVATDLQLSEQGQKKLESRPKEFGIAKGSEEILLGPQDVMWNELGQAMSQELAERKARQLRRIRRGGLVSLVIGIMLVLFILGGTGAAVYSEQARSYLSVLGNNINDFIGVLRENLQQARQSGEFPPQANGRSETSSVEAPQPQDRSLLTEEEIPVVIVQQTVNPGASGAFTPVDRPVPGSQSYSSPLPETEKPDEFQPSVPEEENSSSINTSKVLDETRTVPKRQAQIQIYEDPEIKRQRIQLQLNQALRNRAIAGVSISLIDGTAYLHGQVATEKQRLAAEQAARSVPTVRNVRNRIVVK